MTEREATGQAYSSLVYFAHHEDGSLSCGGRSDGLRCPHCAAKAAADALADGTATQYGIRIAALGERVFTVTALHEAEALARMHDDAEILQRKVHHAEWEPVAP